MIESGKMDQEKVKEEAKQIMDNFMDALKDAELEEEFILERKECMREEGDSADLDEDFRQRFLSNAPKVNGNAIVANKGKWVE